jgi:hypothetical protein
MVDFLAAHPLFTVLDRTEARQNQCAHAVVLFAQGEAERNIRHQTNIPSGQIHRLATDVAWILDGLRKIASVPELGYPQTMTNQLAMLARRVQWGTPAEALDILRVAQKEGLVSAGSGSPYFYPDGDVNFSGQFYLKRSASGGVSIEFLTSKINPETLGASAEYIQSYDINLNVTGDSKEKNNGGQ